MNRCPYCHDHDIHTVARCPVCSRPSSKVPPKREAPDA